MKPIPSGGLAWNQWNPLESQVLEAKAQDTIKGSGGEGRCLRMAGILGIHESTTHNLWNHLEPRSLALCSTDPMKRTWRTCAALAPRGTVALWHCWPLNRVNQRCRTCPHKSHLQATQRLFTVSYKRHQDDEHNAI